MHVPAPAPKGFCRGIGGLQVLDRFPSFTSACLKNPPGHPVSRNLNCEHLLVASLENVRLLGSGWSVEVSMYKSDFLVLHRRSPD